MTKHCLLALFLSIGFFSGVSHAADSLDAILRAAPVNTAAVADTRTVAAHDYSYTPGGFTGKIISDSSGATVYACENDQKNSSTCTGACASNWPPYTVASATGVTVSTAVPALNGADASKVDDAFQRPGEDGVFQVQYGGHPLYAYSGDTGALQTNGQCKTSEGCKWHLVAVDGSLVPCTTGDTGGGSGGSSGESSGGSTESSGGSCGDAGGECGDSWVCGWTPGWHCWNNHNHRGSCCWNAKDSGCKGE